MVHCVNENKRIYIAKSHNGNKPKMIETLAAKSLSSKSELWSTSQQFLKLLEIYLTSCFLSMPINHRPKSNTHRHLSNQTSKTTGYGNADKDAVHTFSSLILMLKRKKSHKPNVT